MTTRSPNVLLLLADQWRGMDQGWRDNHDVHTPHLDRLAEGGVAVHGAYANSPVCGPSRAGLLTGVLPHQHRVVANDLPLAAGVPTIAGVLAGHGYRTGLIGKWHLDGPPRDKWVPPERRRGFEYWAATNCSLAYFDAHYYTGDDPAPVPFQGYEPHVQTDLALDFIGRADERPFFLMMSYGPPHDPYEDVPNEYLARYNAGELTPRGNTSGADDVRRTLHQYYAAISAIDDQVGALVHGLDDRGILEDTIVVVTSDHGDMLGSHGRWAKQVPYEEAISVPMVLSWPGRLEGREIHDGTMGLVDLAPTLLALAGAHPLPNAYGLDLSGAFAGGGRLRDATLLMNVLSCDQGALQGVPDWRGLRNDKLTYARRVDGTPWLLFDNERDVWQQRNLVAEAAGDAGIQAMLGRADRELDDLLAAAGDRALSGEAMLRALDLEEDWNTRQRDLYGDRAELLISQDDSGPPIFPTP